MRGYWFRIGLGALAVFLVGYMGVWLVRSQIVDRAHRMTDSSDPIRIPLAFLPFNVDGERWGTFQRITITRESPQAVSGFHVRVRLADGIDPSRLEACRLTAVDLDRFDLADGFRCLVDTGADSGYVAFGEVMFRGPGGTMITVPLLLDEGTVRELRANGAELARTQGEVARAEAEAARAEALRTRMEVRVRSDSAAP